MTSRSPRRPRFSRADHSHHSAGGPRRQAYQGVAGRLPRSRDWASETTGKAFAEILADHGGGSGVAYAWELQLLDQKAGAGA
jgi:hypothetical protein